jgi:hypothetical protein
MSVEAAFADYSHTNMHFLQLEAQTVLYPCLSSFEISLKQLNKGRISTLRPHCAIFEPYRAQLNRTEAPS